MANFNDLIFKDSLPNSQQAIIFFPNGYGASVITGECAYANEGEYELAVIKGNKNSFHFANTKLVTDTVVGYQTQKQITELLNKIEKLT